MKRLIKKVLASWLKRWRTRRLDFLLTDCVEFQLLVDKMEIPYQRKVVMKQCALGRYNRSVKQVYHAYDVLSCQINSIGRSNKK